MAVSKKNTKNTEEVVNNIEKEQVAEVAEASAKESPAPQSSISLEDIQAMMAKFQATIDTLSTELKAEKEKNEKLAETIKESVNSTVESTESANEVSTPEVTAAHEGTNNATERLLEILGNKKSDKEITIVHNRELAGGLSTAIQLTGLTINFHTLGEQRVLNWQQFEECVSKYRKWFDKEIILLAPEHEDVAERYNVSCLKRGDKEILTKADLAVLYKKNERELEDLMNNLTEADKGFVCSYWLGKCYENDSKYLNRSKIELLNRISGRGFFDNLLTRMNFNSTKN